MQLLLRYLRTPATIGAVAPSSTALARAMSAAAQGHERIVELGAGTGAITAVLRREHPRASLWAYERDPALAARLRRRVAGIAVHAGCVSEDTGLAALAGGPVAVVSSLPFRSLPPREAADLAAWLQDFVQAEPGRTLVQYTYGLREPFAIDRPGLEWVRRGRVWRNLPPATVWELRQRAAAEPAAPAAAAQRESPAGGAPSSTGQSRM